MILHYSFRAEGEVLDSFQGGDEPWYHTEERDYEYEYRVDDDFNDVLDFMERCYGRRLNPEQKELLKYLYDEGMLNLEDNDAYYDYLLEAYEENAYDEFTDTIK